VKAPGGAGKGHDKTKHVNKKYKDEFERIYSDHVHRFNPATGLCVHCFLHRDELFVAMSGELPPNIK
jgi:hypothetical protein